MGIDRRYREGHHQGMSLHSQSNILRVFIRQDARPHLVVLQGPPNAHLLVITYSTDTSSLVVSNSTPLHPPTPSLRSAEFFQGVVVQGMTVIVSLWVGVLSCLELEVEKDKDLKRRRSSVAASVQTVPDKRLRIRENYNIKSVITLGIEITMLNTQCARTESSVASISPRHIIGRRSRRLFPVAHTTQCPSTPDASILGDFAQLHRPSQADGRRGSRNGQCRIRR